MPESKGKRVLGRDEPGVFTHNVETMGSFKAYGGGLNSFSGPATFQKWLEIPHRDTDPTGWGTNERGRTFFHTTANLFKFWDGSQLLGLVAGPVGNFTQGSIPFGDAAGALTQDNANLFWDATNDRLGVATNTPSTTLDVAGGIGTDGNLDMRSNDIVNVNYLVFGTTAPMISVVSSDLVLVPAAGGAAKFFHSAASGENPYVYVYGYDTGESAVKYGRMNIDASGDFVLDIEHGDFLVPNGEVILSGILTAVSGIGCDANLDMKDNDVVQVDKLVFGVSVPYLQASGGALLSSDAIVIGLVTDTTMSATLLVEEQSSGFNNTQYFNFQFGDRVRWRLYASQLSATENDYDLSIQVTNAAQNAYVTCMTLDGVDTTVTIQNGLGMDANIDMKGNDIVNVNYLVFGASAPMITVDTNDLLIMPAAGGDAKFFSSAASGETPGLLVYGYKSGDSLRAMTIAVGAYQNDTATFAGVSVYGFAGKVGVGTNEPAKELDVAGEIILSGDMYFANNQAINFRNVADDADWAMISLNGSDKLELGHTSCAAIITPAGVNFGIATTSPDQLLDVRGNIALGRFNDGIDKYVGQTHGAGGIGSSSGATVKFTSDVDGGGYSNAIEFITHHYLTSIGTRMLIDKDGLVNFKIATCAHGVTGYAPTDTYGLIKEAGSGTGGVRLGGISEVTISTRIDAIATTDNTAKDATAQAPIFLVAAKKSGVNPGAVGANGNLMVITNNISTRFIFDEDGDMFYDGAAPANYDEYDDAIACHDLQRHLYNLKRPASKHLTDFIQYNKADLVSMGVVSEGGFVSNKGLAALQLGAISQLHNREVQLEGRVEELESKLKQLEA